MTIYIVLFRGVGGATQLPVGKLRAALTAAGLEKVGTYINSGNAVLESGLDRQGVIEVIAKVCRKEFGFVKSVFAPTLEEWRLLIERNPFSDAAKDGKFLHAALLADTPTNEAIERLKGLAHDGDRFEVISNVAYLHTPSGFSNSKLSLRFDKWIGVDNTARNWNSVLRLRDLAESKLDI